MVKEQCPTGEHFAMTGSPDEGYYVGNIRGVPRRPFCKTSLLMDVDPSIFWVSCVGPINIYKPHEILSNPPARTHRYVL